MTKYRAQKTTVDNIVFDSKREAARYQELKLLAWGCEIKDLQLQPEFKFTVNGEHVFTYRADFSYFDPRKDCAVVEDVKGFKTPVYRLKKKLIERQLGIKITEVS